MYRFLENDRHLLDNLSMENFEKIVKKYNDAFNTINLFESILPRKVDRFETL